MDCSPDDRPHATCGPFHVCEFIYFSPNKTLSKSLVHDEVIQVHTFNNISDAEKKLSWPEVFQMLIFFHYVLTPFYVTF